MYRWMQSLFSVNTNRNWKKRFGVAKIGIFGSFVRGEERPDSDVDVLVTAFVFKLIPQFSEFMRSGRIPSPYRGISWTLNPASNNR